MFQIQNNSSGLQKSFTTIFICFFCTIPIVFAHPDDVPAGKLSSEEQRSGYEHLFQMSQAETEGLQAVLLPLSQDIASSDLQLQKIAQQKKRIEDINALVAKKMASMKDLEEQFQLQEKFVTLSMKSLGKKLEKLLSFFVPFHLQFVRSDGSVDILKLLSLSTSPSDELFQDFLITRVKDQLLLSMKEASREDRHLAFLQAEVSRFEVQLAAYAEELTQSKNVLAQQALTAAELKKQQEHEQGFFQKALNEARAQQELIHKRISLLAGEQSRADYVNFPTQSIVWPVAPLLGISTTFHDGAYLERFGIPHEGIDIPIDQLSLVKAALSGKVIKVVDGGETGYSYIQIMHKDAASTVYGHVYESKVEEGQDVEQGQVIALSGGAIGAHGSGRLTTGPHLHFELLRDGNHVDPLKFLPKWSTME